MDISTRENILETLKFHAARYPKMTPTDAVKLLYQREFGGGHLIRDVGRVRAMLVSELERAVRSPYGAVEPLGNSIVRVDLKSAEEIPLTVDDLVAMFVATANAHTGDIAAFEDSLEVLKVATFRGILPFDSDALDAYLSFYAKVNGIYPPVSHSDVYRREYSPSYRIIDERFVRLFPVIARVNALLREREHVVVAIDGRCASGKTTACDLLAKVFACASIVRADDFFLPPTMRTSERYAEPGGNLDRERFIAEVLPHIGRREFEYGRFDCSVGRVTSAVSVPLNRLTLVEGSYSTHPAFGHYADLTVFSNIDHAERMRRLRERDGDYAAVFESRWIPLEEAYFAAFDVMSKCDIVI